MPPPPSFLSNFFFLFFFGPPFAHKFFLLLLLFGVFGVSAGDNLVIVWFISSYFSDWHSYVLLPLRFYITCSHPSFFPSSFLSFSLTSIKHKLLPPPFPFTLQSYSLFLFLLFPCTYIYFVFTSSPLPRRLSRASSGVSRGLGNVLFYHHKLLIEIYTYS